MKEAIARALAAKAFGRTNRKAREVVFYSEGPSSWPHLEPLITQLTTQHARRPVYLTSRADDPGLGRRDIDAFEIGSKSVRDFVFRSADADVWVMTTPDLDAFSVKRSRFPVRYVYVHHSIVSTHMAYRPAAFDAFDEVFCVGPHHAEEIRERERRQGLPGKMLIEHGYGRLDSLMAAPRIRSPRRGAPLRVLVAPSWGPHGLLETVGLETVAALLEAGHHVTVRPHPRTTQLRPEAVERLRGMPHQYLRIDEDAASDEALLSADVMVSDWSGAALEYAFALERPVVFVDVPRKVNNLSYEEFPQIPLEVRIRDEIGMVVPRGDGEALTRAVRALADVGGDVSDQIRAVRQRSVFNVGSSAVRGAERLADLADELGRQREA